MRDRFIERIRTGRAAALLTVGITLVLPLRAAAQNNIVVDWNAIAITAAGAAGQNGHFQERTLAITSVAAEYHTSEYVNVALRPKRSEIELKISVPKNIPANPAPTNSRRVTAVWARGPWEPGLRGPWRAAVRRGG